MKSMYQKWLNTEAEWIGAYCRRTRRNSLLKIAPLTLVLSALLFGGIAFLWDGSMDGLLTGVAGGLFFGFVICAFYLAILFVSLRPARYVRKIEQSVQETGIGEMEREQLGKEMLDALEHEEQVMSYEMWGPNVKGTPARLLITHNYVFQEGSAPYAVLVRRSDIAEIRLGSERKTAVTRGAKTKTYHHFTLYSIGFYRKDRFERGLGGDGLPDTAMGFFQEELRDAAAKRLEESGIRIQAPEK